METKNNFQTKQTHGLQSGFLFPFYIFTHNYKNPASLKSAKQCSIFVIIRGPRYTLLPFNTARLQCVYYLLQLLYIARPSTVLQLPQNS